MKNTTLIISLLLLSASCNRSAGPQMAMSSYSCDLGTIANDGIHSGHSIIKNTGRAKLVIHGVSSGCGCTKATLSKHVIDPRDTAMLTFTFDPKGKRGPQSEFVIINANTDSLVHLFQITAVVK